MQGFQEKLKISISFVRENISYNNQLNIAAVDNIKDSKQIVENMENMAVSGFFPSLPIPPHFKVIAISVIKAISTIANILIANNEATEKENQIREQKALRISQITRDIKEKILLSLLTASKDFINNSFKDSIELLSNDIDNIKDTINRDKNMKSILNESRIKINSIKF
mgnify:CR=1 FL=1